MKLPRPTLKMPLPRWRGNAPIAPPKLLGGHLPLGEDHAAPIISVRGLVNRFGSQTVHDGLDLDIYPGEILGIVGGSGTGKTVLLKSILGLHEPNAGSITFLDTDVMLHGEQRQGPASWGVLFQSGALFSGLTVLENVCAPLLEHTTISRETVRELAILKLRMVGLTTEACHKFPSELSGGMVKRAALARALAIDPPIVFLDEPTSGLDPIAAEEFDELVLYLKHQLELTIVMISHDLDSLFTTCDRIGVLVDRRLVIDTPAGILTNPHPWIARYFGGPRGQLRRNAGASGPAVISGQD